jgi:hypothetical protein
VRYPYRWVLENVAQLRRSELYTLPTGNQLNGNIVHKLAHRWFARSDSLEASEHEFERWFDSTFPELVEASAVELLLPQRSSEKERLRRASLAALKELARLFAEERWSVANAEKDVTATLAELPVHGRADIVLDRAGERAIVDLKWARRRHWEKQLRAGTPYQLAFYARAAQGNTDGIDKAYGAYFVVSPPPAVLLAGDREGFAKAFVPHGTQRSITHVADDFEQILAHRFGELSEGKLTVGDHEDVPPYEVYHAFLGWER